MEKGANFCSVSKSRSMQEAMQVAYIRGKRDAYRFLVSGYEGKRPLG